MVSGVSKSIDVSAVSTGGASTCANAITQADLGGAFDYSEVRLFGKIFTP